jgi:tripartite-type tricarboxylate transporter receptor subunit TctC
MARRLEGTDGVPTRRAAAFLAVMLPVVALASALGAIPAQAQTVEQFYAGRQVKLFVGGGAGGGYDFYARIIAPYMSKYLPGNPNIVVQGMPGAGGIVGANHLYLRAPRDGSELAIVGRVVSTHPLLNPKDTAVKYDARKLNWIGTPLQDVGLLIVRATSPINTLRDLKVHPLLIAGTAPSAPPSFYPTVMNKVFGTKFQVVTGYGGLQEALLAVERGEAEAYMGSSASAALRDRIAPWLKEGKVKLVAQIGLSSDPRNGGVPLILDLAETPMERQLMEVILAQQVMAWPFVAPPGLPDDRLKALRHAFDATMQDSAFLAEAAKARTEIDPVSGPKLHELIEQVYATPDELLTRLQSLNARP